VFRCRLEAAQLGRVFMQDTNFFESSLAYADFGKAQMERVAFARCELGNAVLKPSICDQIVVTESRVDQLDCRGAQLLHLMLFRMDLRTVEFAQARCDGSILMECNLEGQRLPHTAFLRCQFTDSAMAGVDFSGAVLTQSNFKGATLTHANFSGADAAQAMFPQADLRGANCSDAVFDQSIWSDAKLEGTDFSRSRLPLSVFHRARARGASFRDADLHDADLSYADLHGADLRNARFLRTRFHRAAREGARFSGSGGIIENDSELFKAQEIRPPS